MYRDQLGSDLKRRGEVALAATVSSFSASFAKRRWDMLHDLLVALCKLRPLWAHWGCAQGVV